MQTFRRCAVLVCVIALPFSRGAAQSVTITEEDVREQMAVGKFIINQTDTLTKSVNIGLTGATSWDFSALLSHTSTALTSVTPSTTPYISSFPNATFALQTEVGFPQVPGITLTAFVYLVLDTNLTNPGIMGGTSTIFGPVVYNLTNAPSDVTYALPSTFGTTWNSVYLESTVVTLNGSPVYTENQSHNARCVVDAYGPMTLPGGLVQEALRIRIDDSTSDGEGVTYIFVSKNGALVRAKAAGPALPDTGTIPVASVMWNGPVPTDIQVAGGMPTEFVLRQNFPNPFNPTTTIEYTLPRSGFVTLKVYNTLGQELATLVSGEEVAGKASATWSASGFPSGVYFYRMTAGEYVETKKMLLMK